MRRLLREKHGSSYKAKDQHTPRHFKHDVVSMQKTPTMGIRLAVEAKPRDALDLRTGEPQQMGASLQVCSHPAQGLGNVMCAASNFCKNNSKLYVVSR